mgnify:CR=1 FL=1
MYLKAVERKDRLEKFKVLMNSMTKEELENPKIIKRSRINRIATGSGSDKCSDTVAGSDKSSE